METNNNVNDGGLQREEIKKLQDRTCQLFELIAFDPTNEPIYRNEIIEINIRLVPHVLRKYKPFGDDEFQLGCLGLIVATRSFNPERGVPFASYACFCIERELHKAHRYNQGLIEFGNFFKFESLDFELGLDNGDKMNKHDQIADDDAEYAFEQVLTEYSLSDFFDVIIMPTIEQISKTNKGQQTKVDFEKWKELELRYILEMAQVGSQKARMTFTHIANELGTSTQNVRIRHQRVIEAIKERCQELGYHV